MNIDSIRKEISEKLQTTSSHIDVYNVSEPYKNILESCINSNPKNISAYCLLAMVMEGMNQDDERTATLEKYYEENRDTFSNDEYAMWATCNAYFIFDDYGYVESKDNYKAYKFLEEAVKRKSSFYQTYYALGWYYFENKLFEKASEMFQTAYSISKNKKYLYCQASSLLKSSKHKDGLEILESIYTYPFIEEELELNFEIALTLGFTLALMDETGRASEVAEILLNTNTDKFYNANADWPLTDFLYTLGNFEYIINYYDENKYSEDASWRGQYFYSLKMLGKEKEAHLKLKSLIKEYEESIHEEENNTSYGTEDADWETDEDRIEYIVETKEMLESINKCYNDVFKHNIKPTRDPYYDIIYECYYIGCPRHYID